MKADSHLKVNVDFHFGITFMDRLVEEGLWYVNGRKTCRRSDLAPQHTVMFAGTPVTINTACLVILGLGFWSHGAFFDRCKKRTV